MAWYICKSSKTKRRLTVSSLTQAGQGAAVRCALNAAYTVVSRKQRCKTNSKLVPMLACIHCKPIVQAELSANPPQAAQGATTGQ